MEVEENKVQYKSPYPEWFIDKSRDQEQSALQQQVRANSLVFLTY